MPGSLSISGWLTHCFVKCLTSNKKRRKEHKEEEDEDEEEGKGKAIWNEDRPSLKNIYPTQADFFAGVQNFTPLSRCLGGSPFTRFRKFVGTRRHCPHERDCGDGWRFCWQRPE